MADYFPLCACVCIIICPNVLTHSSFDGRLGCLRVLAIVNNSEVNIPRQISIFLFFSADNPRGIAGSIFHFLRKLHMFSTVAAPIYIPTKGAQGFLFLRILVNTCRFLLFWWQPFSQVCSDIALWFWFAFPWWFSVLSIFIFPCACCLGKCLFRSSVHFLIGIVWVFAIELYEFFIYFGF